MATKKEQDVSWYELCEWVEINIFNYDVSKQKLQRKASLVLQGLSKGQEYANTNRQTYGEYPYHIILMTFKANKVKILNAIRNKDFDNESKKMSYICAIVRDKLNDVYSRYLNAQKAEEKVESVNLDIMTYEGAEYKNTDDTRKVNKRLEGLW